MNKTLILIFAFSLFIAVNSQATHKGIGLNYTNAYAFLRLQNYSLTAISVLPDNWNQYLLVVTNSLAPSWNPDNSVAAKFYAESSNRNTTANVTGIQNDLFVGKLNLSDNTSFVLKDNFTGNLTNPLSFWLVDPVQGYSYLATGSEIENCTYFLINGNIKDNVFQSTCNYSIYSTTYKVQLRFNLTISLPRQVVTNNTGANYQLRLTLNQSLLNSYHYDIVQVKDSDYQFPFLVQYYQDSNFTTFVDPKNSTQANKQCNISATFDFKDKQWIDPCVAVSYEGSRFYNGFVLIYYCANLTANNLNSTNNVNTYQVQGNFFNIQQRQGGRNIIVRQFVSTPQQIVVGTGLPGCSNNASILNFKNIIIVALVFILSQFA